MKSFLHLSLSLFAAGALLCSLSIRANAQWHQTEAVSYLWVSSSTAAGVTATHGINTATLAFSNPFNINSPFNSAYEIDSFRRYNSWQASGPPGSVTQYYADVTGISVGVGFDTTTFQGTATFSASGQVGIGTYLQAGASYPSVGTYHDYLSQETNSYYLNTNNYAHVHIKLSSASSSSGGYAGTQYGNGTAQFPDVAY